MGDDANNVLLLAPAGSEGDRSTCKALLAPGDGETAVLAIAITEPPGERLEGYEEAHGSPEAAAVIHAQGGSVGGEGVDVRTLNSPGDLTGMGIEVDKILQEWEGEGLDVRVCFHSLTPLLQYVDLQKLFRFLHVLTARFRDVGAVAHFHIDPEAHDQQDLSVLRSLFDRVEEGVEEERESGEQAEAEGEEVES